MQKKFFGFSLAAAVILVAAISGLVRSRVAAQNLGSREFTIIRSEISNTKIPMKLMSFDAQRGDGAQATGDYIIPNGPADIQHLHTRLVVLPSTGERISIDDIAHARTTMYTTPAGRPTSADPTCGFGKIGAAVKPVLKGTEEILGFKTVVTQTDDGPYLTTTWKAPDLDCKVVKMTEDRRDQNGTITGHFELQALQITLGPPNASFFAVPADYVEMAPSQRETARRNATGASAPLSNSVTEALQQRDARYYQNHQQAGK